MTETIFFDVFERGVVGVAISDLRAAMPTPFDVRRRSECAAELSDSATSAASRAALSESLITGDGSAFREALAEIAENPFPECSFRCSHAEANRLIDSIVQKWDALAKQIGAGEASIAVVAMLPWLDYRDAEERERPSAVFVARLASTLVTGSSATRKVADLT